MTMCYASSGAKDGKMMPDVRVIEARAERMAVSRHASDRNLK
jgi:hypothetical protein